MATPRKLCYVCEATQGGVRKHLVDLVRVFSGAGGGFRVHAILGDRGEPGLREELDALAGAGDFKYSIVPTLQRSIRLSSDFSAYSEIKERMRAFGPDVVHTHSAKAGGLGRQAAHQLGVENIIHTPHVFPFQWKQGLGGRVYLAIERHLARMSRSLICVSESQRADALARGVSPAEKLIVVPNGIELPPLPSVEERAAVRARLELPPNAPVVGMVARLAPQKGVGVFVRAAAETIRKRPDVVFLLVGGGPLEAYVRTLASELKLSPDQFRVLGHRSDAEALYPAFDLLALSSLYEGLPYVLLEAMARGLPVVATDVLGSRDVVVNGETGFLARVDDPKHVADRVLTLLNDPPFHRRAGLSARRRVEEQFSFGAFVEGHRRLYDA